MFLGGHRGGPPGEHRWEDDLRGYRGGQRGAAAATLITSTPGRRRRTPHPGDHHVHRQHRLKHCPVSTTSAGKHLPSKQCEGQGQVSNAIQSASGMQIPLGGKLGSRPIPVIERRSTVKLGGGGEVRKRAEGVWPPHTSARRGGRVITNKVIGFAVGHLAHLPTNGDHLTASSISSIFRPACVCVAHDPFVYGSLAGQMEGPGLFGLSGLLGCNAWGASVCQPRLVVTCGLLAATT